jgi:hypothetical protein
MTVNFTFETSDGLLLKGEVDIWCHSNDGDYGYEEVRLFTAQDADFDENLLSLKDKALLEEQCDELARDHSCEAYQSYCEGMADWHYERTKDEMYD